MGYIYLATPYTHDSPEVLEHRYNTAVRFAAHLIKLGHNIYSPIAHSHNIAAHIKPRPITNEAWKQHNLALLRHCSELWVAVMPGWDTSLGIQFEVAMADKLDIKVRYMPVPESCYDD